MDDVVTQQILDNLAKFKQNPNGVPHFAYPAGAQSRVSDSISGSPGFDFRRWTLGGWGLGFSGGRDDTEGFTMQPVTDPYKLTLMRCLFQRAACGINSADCADCDKQFNRFYFGTVEPPKTDQLAPSGGAALWWSGQTVKLVDGKIPTSTSELEFEPTEPNHEIVQAIEDDYGNVNYWSYDGVKTVLTDQRQIEALLATDKLRPLYQRDTLANWTQRTGRITPACLRGGWVRCGDPDGIRDSTCCDTGEYCGTQIWVPVNAKDQLAILTLLVLEVARHEPASPPAAETEPQRIELTIANSRETASKATRDSGFSLFGLSPFSTPADSESADKGLQTNWKNVGRKSPKIPKSVEFNALTPTSNAVESILNERTREALVR